VARRTLAKKKNQQKNKQTKKNILHIRVCKDKYENFQTEKNVDSLGKGG
jgi:hypothetical protein